MSLTATIRLMTVLALVTTIASCTTLDSKRMAIYDEITRQVLNDSLPNLEIGKPGMVTSNTVEIWYELLQSPSDKVKGTVLFIEGLEGTAMGWGAYTYQPVLAAGYNVIRMDNREVGRSTWTENIDYDLADMAKDVLAVTNDLHVDAVHLVGQSMGGMIAQEFALNYPEKVKTLTLIYTSGDINDDSLPGPSEEFIETIIAAHVEYSKDDLASKIKLELAIMDASNAVHLERDDLLFIAQRTRYEIEKRKGKNEKASDIQQEAINNSDARFDRLSEIKMPTLIIHGEKDPLINIAHGQKLASFIPHAKTVWVQNYGHNLPIGFSKIITDALIRMIE